MIQKITGNNRQNSFILTSERQLLDMMGEFYRSKTRKTFDSISVIF